jgi:TolB-like protein
MTMTHCRTVGARVAALLGLLLLPTAGQAQDAASVGAGLAGLARQIIEKSTAADRTTLAVLPFPNADGSCSVLSTYIVDELILHLFSFPESKIEIVERSQLEAILAELEMGEGGLLNPATTKQLGNLSGVTALALGTITVIGDAIRLNARLIATETGKTISAAAVTIPKTQALADLLARPMAAGPTCGSKAIGSPRRSSSSATSSGTPSATYPAPQHISDEAAQMIVSGIRGTVTTAGRSNDGKLVSFALLIENVSDMEMRIGLIGPAPLATDNHGTEYKFRSFSGASACRALDANAIGWCLKGGDGTFPWESYSKLLPGSKTTLTFSFSSDRESSGTLFSFSSTFALLTVKNMDSSTGDTTGENEKGKNILKNLEQTTIGFGISDIQVGTKS